MGREVLNPGDILCLTGKDGKIERKFEIREVIGMGGICIAYDVVCPNGMVGRLKEFYPAEDESGDVVLIRKGNYLFRNPWYKDEKQAAALRKRFFGGYEKMKDIHVQVEEARNEMPNYGEMYKGEDSLYWFMSYDEGNCYSRVRDESLTDVCKVGLSTARAVKRYHKLGYLHLDIKEENIFILSQTREYVKLIDFDNLIKKEELREENEILGFSEQTAAPEVMKGRRTEIAETADYYSIGAMIYRRILKKEVTFRERLYTASFDMEDVLEEYGDIKWELGELLNQFFKKTLVSQPKWRYQTMEELEKQLCRIIDLASPIEKELEKTAVQKNVLCLFSQLPVYKYQRKKKEVHVLIDGTGEMADTLLKTVFGCCGQMLEHKLYLYVSCSKKEVQKARLQKMYPALQKMAVLDQEDKTMFYRLVEQPLAEISFTEWEQICEDVCSEREDRVCYFIFADENQEQNKYRANYIWRKLREKKDLSAAIAVFCEEDIQKEEGSLIFRSFGARRNRVDEKFYRKLVRQAFQIHRVYEKMLDGQAETSYENFCKNIYNYRSSIENAMHIECKLAGCGIWEEDEEKAANLFKEKVLKHKEDNPEPYHKLLYLEHRRWMASTIMQGWDMYPKEELARIKFGKKGGFKNVRKKLHPCLVDCNSHSGAVLSKWGKERWDQEEESKEESELDNLDRISLYLHRRAGQLCRRNRQIVENRQKEIEQELEDMGEAFPISWIEMKKNVERMMKNMDNTAFHWKDVAEKARKDIEKEGNESLQRYFEELYEALLVYQEYYLYHDYKLTDGILIDHIPEFLKKGKLK